VLPGAHSREIRLQKWAAYAGSHPGRWEAFRFRVRAQDPVAFGGQLKAGEFHFAAIDWFQHYLIRRGAFGNGSLLAQSSNLASFSAFWFNCNARRSALGDGRLRRALAEALPWEFLMAQRRLRATRLAGSLWPPQSMAYSLAQEPLPRLERAATLLDEAGWRRGPDGWRRDAKGRPLRLVMYSRENYSRRDSAQAFSDSLRKVGVELDLRRTHSDGVLAQAARGEGDIWDYSWSTGLDPDNESPLFTSEGIRGGTNYTGYSNPEVDRLFEAARHELDQARRQDLYLRINARIQEDQPLLQLTYDISYLAVDRHLRGVEFSSLGRTYGLVPGRRSWWLAP
jgi:peptide/nickel transport system substrate-binding protein